MLTKRIIPCLDIRNKKVTKGVRFQGNIDLGDPVELAYRYYNEGCDELVFYDITASAEGRPIDIEMVKEVARSIRIPFAVGGGISNIKEMSDVLLAGAEKISVNSHAVKNPKIINEGAKAFGSQCIVLGMDPLWVGHSPAIPSGYEITTHGFRKKTGIDAVKWAKMAQDMGAGEIVVNSVDADGTRQGYEIQLTRLIAESVDIPVVASGGAGNPQHIAEVFIKANADAAIIAGIIHTGAYTIPQIKQYLTEKNIPVRKKW